MVTISESKANRLFKDRVAVLGLCDEELQIKLNPDSNILFRLTAKWKSDLVIIYLMADYEKSNIKKEKNQAETPE